MSMFILKDYNLLSGIHASSSEKKDENVLKQLRKKFNASLSADYCNANSLMASTVSTTTILCTLRLSALQTDSLDAC